MLVRNRCLRESFVKQPVRNLETKSYNVSTSFQTVLLFLKIRDQCMVH